METGRAVARGRAWMSLKGVGGFVRGGGRFGVVFLVILVIACWSDLVTRP